MMERIAIYTSIIGDYDRLQQPAAIAPDVDFICFVAKGEKRCEQDGVWQIRELDVDIADPQLLSRYPKTHPHLLLPEYELSLWIDGNIAITDASIYKALHTKACAGVGYSGVEHPARDCVYAEARKCRDMKYISNFALLKVWAWLLFHGQKQHKGLMENNLIFRRHNKPEIIALNELWWDKICNLCRRDQISFMWCLQRCGVPRDFLLPPGQSSRNHPGLKYLQHK